MKKQDDEPDRWSVTPDGLTWLDEHKRPLQVDSTGRLLVGAVIRYNGKREWVGPGTNPGYTPKAIRIMGEAESKAIEAARAKNRHLTREQLGRIMAEALDAALRASRLGQMALPVDLAG